jgi:hypothetical protein
MADVCPTGLPIDNTAFVVSENFLVGIDRDNDWSPIKCSLQLVLIVSGNLPLVCNSHTWIQFLALPIALRVLSDLIWVVSLLHQWVHSGVCESIVREATLATEVTPH